MSILGKAKPTKRRVAFAEKFNADCSEIAIAKFGARKLAAEESDPDPYDYFTIVMPTRYGDMKIWPATDPESVLDGRHRGSFFTVFCRFETDDREVLRAAADHLGSNPYSGKYNFHLECGNTPADLEAALRAFEQHLAMAAIS